MANTELRKKFEAAIATTGHRAARTEKGGYMASPARILWHAVRTHKREWSSELMAACYLMLCLLDDIEVTGGLVRSKDGIVAPAVDADWVDLGDISEKMLGFLLREAGIPTNILTIKEESDEE